MAFNLKLLVCLAYNSVKSEKRASAETSNMRKHKSPSTNRNSPLSVV
jgi:hypothetical protein